MYPTWGLKSPSTTHLRRGAGAQDRVASRKRHTSSPTSQSPVVFFRQLGDYSERRGRKAGRDAWSYSRKEQSRLGDKGNKKNASATNANERTNPVLGFN